MVLPARTDTQVFCYDEQNRLVWAGSAGAPSCSSSTVPFSTLPGASYTQSFGYDGLTRLSHSGLGAYTYGDSAHLDAVTAAGSNGQGGPFYTARYDAEGIWSAGRRLRSVGSLPLRLRRR